MLRDLRGISKENSDFVARHLVAATSLADEEPEQAWLHARAARSKGGRIAVVRETVGLVAYRAQEWAEAISELRAARRMGGGPGHVAILADCERALGNPERALDLARSPEAAQLDEDGAAELRIVASGARADMGQLDAALAVLQDGPGFDLENPTSYSGRLFYAYADLLLTTGKADEALQWFVRADDADDDGDTDAADRIADLIAIREGRDPAAAGDAGVADDASEEPAEAAGDDVTDGSDAESDHQAEAADTSGGSVAAATDDVDGADSTATDDTADNDTSTDDTAADDSSADNDTAADDSSADDSSADSTSDDAPVSDATPDQDADTVPSDDDAGNETKASSEEESIGRGSVLFSSGNDA